jgi:cellulose synthase (UDP-forming)
VVNAFLVSAADCCWPGALAAGAGMAALPWLKRDSAGARATVVAIVLALMWRYILWRWIVTLPPFGFTLDTLTALVFIFVETAALIGATISFFFLSRVRDRAAEVEANMGWLTSQPMPPLIDVFICTYNEEEAILEQTIVGALAMDYPNYRLWTLDDGRRPWLRALCERLDCGYVTRPDNAHAKAGNINNALKRVAALDPPPDYVSILDADFVPTPNFLTRAMTLFHEDDVGVVQTPQHFANPDPMQRNLSLARVWPDEQRYFFDVIMASKDAWNAAFCCGTSSIVRFAPLMRIGGFPTDSVTEDYLLTLRLRQIGYRTVYLNERLSLGLAPEGLREYIVQRSRWCLGFMQICVGRSGPLRPGAGLSLVDRLILSETFLHWAATHLYRLLGLALPLSYFLFGIVAVRADISDTLYHFLPYFIAQTQAVAWLSGSRALPIMGDLSHLLAASSIVKAVWQGLTKPQGQKFVVTAKGGDRSKRFVQTRLLATFMALLVLTVAGVCRAFIVDPVSELSSSASLPLFWSWYNIVVLTLACIVCVEQPRFRRSERFDGRGSVARLIVDGRAMFFLIADISTGGMRLSGVAPGPVGAALTVLLDGRQLHASVVRAGATDFAIAVEDEFEARAAMIRAVYSGRYDPGVMEVSPVQVVVGLARRLFN